MMCFSDFDSEYMFITLMQKFEYPFWLCELKYHIIIITEETHCCKHVRSDNVVFFFLEWWSQNITFMWPTFDW